jgi:hypothetical protein
MSHLEICYVALRHQRRDHLLKERRVGISGGSSLNWKLARKWTNLLRCQLSVLMFNDQDFPSRFQGFGNGWSAYTKALGDSGLTDTLNQFWQWRLFHVIASANLVRPNINRRLAF